MAESAALMVSGDHSQLGIYTNNLALQAQYLQELEAKYAAGEISQSAYVEGLTNINDATLEQLSSIQEVDKTMTSYYGDTLAAAVDELTEYTDLMDRGISVLEHYSTMLKLLGQ